MASKVMTFRFPTELAEEIVTRSQRTGKDKTAIVIEALTQTFGLPSPSPAPITIEALQQQLNYLQDTVAGLSQQLASYHQTQPFQLDDRTLHRITKLEHLIYSFQALSTTLSLKVEDFLTPDLSAKSIKLAAVEPHLLEEDNSNNPFNEERLRLIGQMEQQTKILDQILSASPDLIYVVDKMGRFTYVNQTFARVLGIDRTATLGKTSQELVGDLSKLPESIKQIACQREAVFVNGQSASGEISFFTPNETSIYEYILSPIYGVGGAVDSVVCTARNITERKQADIDLRESEAKYRNLFEAANDSIFIIDAVTLRILNANWNAVRRLGYTRQDLLKLSFYDIELPMDVACSEAIRRELQARGNVLFEHIHRRKDGSEMPIEVSSRMIEYEGQLAYLSFTRDITERKRAEEALHESSDRLALALDSAKIGIWDWNMQTGEILWTHYHEVIFGYEPGTPKRSYTDWSSRVHPDDLPQIESIVQIAIESRQDFRAEYRVQWPDGSLHWAKGHGVFYYNDQGQPIRMLGVLSDITEHKQVEAEILALNVELEQRVLERTAELGRTSSALQTSEARLRAVFEQAAVGIGMTTVPDVQFIRANQRYCDMLGYTEAELMERTFQEITHPDDVEVNLELLRQLIANQIPTFSLEKRYIRKDGQVQWANVSVSLVRDPSGAPEYFICVIEDIQERKQAEEALRQSEERLQLLTNSLPVCIAYVDADRRYRFANRTYEQWFGYKPEEVCGKYGWEVIGEDAYRIVESWIDRALAGEIVMEEAELPYPQGGTHDITTTLIPDVGDNSQVKGYYVLTTDISDRKLIEADRKQAEESLRQSEEGFRILIEQAAIGITRATASGQFLQVNPWFCEMVGYTESELLQMTFQELTHPDDVADNREYSRQLWATEISTFSLEKRYIRKDSQVIWVEVNGSLVCDSDGVPQYSIGIVEDISDRKGTGDREQGIGKEN